MKRIVFSIVALLFLVAIAEGHGISRDITEGFSFDIGYMVGFDPTYYEINLLVGVGFFHNFDLLVNPTTVKIEDNKLRWKEFWLMPRFDVGGIGPVTYNIFGLGLGYSLKPHHDHQHGGRGSKASTHSLNGVKIYHEGHDHEHDHSSERPEILDGKFRGFVGYFSEIDVANHFFVVGLESSFNFAPKLWLDAILSPTIILESLVGFHLGVMADLSLHTHFDDIHFGAGLGIDLQLDWFRFRIGYDFLHNHLGGEIGVTFLP